MEEKKIFSIEKGWGEGSTFYSISDKVHLNYKVDEIKEEMKFCGKGYHNDLTLVIYCGYKNGEKIFEIEANSSLTIMYASN
jgi:hypothetical protein